MIKSILAVVAGLAVAMPAQAASWKDINLLTELVAGTGTEVKVDDCEDGIHGFYQYNKEKGIDLLMICKNSVDMQDPDAVWETLVHESTHVMQACYGGPITKDTYLPRMLRELQTLAPHYYRILQQYPDGHKRLEVEAFWMELRAPQVSIDWIKNFCYSDN